MPRINWSADMSAEWDDRRFNRRVRQLRAEFPPGCRVVVKLKGAKEVRDEDGSACHAVTIVHPKSYEIWILRNKDISQSIRFLCDEWAHVLAPPTTKRHHNRWRNIHHKILFTLIGD